MCPLFLTIGNDQPASLLSSWLSTVFTTNLHLSRMSNPTWTGTSTGTTSTLISIMLSFGTGTRTQSFPSSCQLRNGRLIENAVIWTYSPRTYSTPSHVLLRLQFSELLCLNTLLSILLKVVSFDSFACLDHFRSSGRRSKKIPSMLQMKRLLEQDWAWILTLLVGISLFWSSWLVYHIRVLHGVSARGQQIHCTWIRVLDFASGSLKIFRA